MLSRLAFAILLLCLWCAPVSAQSVATIAVKTCTLVMSAKAGPDGTTSGWSVQFKRNADNQGATDSTAPYGPRSASVNAGIYALTAVWTKGGQTITEPIGTATCQGGTVSLVPATAPPPPPPPAEVCGDGIDNDKDGQIDEGCPPPPTGASPDGTAVPPASSITDNTGAAWTLGEALSGVTDVRYVKRNGQFVGVGNPVYGYSLLYSGGSVYLFGADKTWYRWDSTTWVRHGTTRPGDPVPQPPSSDVRMESRTLAFSPDRAEYDTVVSRYQLLVVDLMGAVLQSFSLGKPALSTDGGVSMPVVLTLVPGRTYRASVAACSVTACGVYSAEAEFVF